MTARAAIAISTQNMGAVAAACVIPEKPKTKKTCCFCGLGTAVTHNTKRMHRLLIIECAGVELLRAHHGCLESFVECEEYHALMRERNKINFAKYVKTS